MRACILAACAMCCVLAAAAADLQAMPAACRQLRIGTGGTFKILQLSDLEFTDGQNTPCKDETPSETYRNVPCVETRTTRFIIKLLQAEQPDLTVITGDSIVAGASNPRRSLTQLLEPVVRYGRPWALVFGNHDEESGLTRTQMLEHVRAMDPAGACLVSGPEALPGVGNYNLTVLDATGTFPVASLFLFDSGKGHNPHGGYDWITTSQVLWLHRVAQLTQAWRDEHAGAERAAVPLLLFFHIPLPEYRQLLEVEYEKRITGSYLEKVWHSDINGGLYAAAVENGNVRAMFAGHDHLNDFCHRNIVSGIYLCYAGSAGYGAYSRKGVERRARLVSITTDGTARTWKRLDDDDFTVLDNEKLLTEKGRLPEHPELRGTVVWAFQPHEMKALLLVTGFVAGALCVWLLQLAAAGGAAPLSLLAPADGASSPSPPWSWPWARSARSGGAGKTVDEADKAV